MFLRLISLGISFIGAGGAWQAIYGSFLLVFPMLLMLLSRAISTIAAYSFAVLVLLVISGVKIRNIFILVASCIAGLWNILMNLSLAPIAVMELPFISYGNSSLF